MKWIPAVTLLLLGFFLFADEQGGLTREADAAFLSTGGGRIQIPPPLPDLARNTLSEEADALLRQIRNVLEREQYAKELGVTFAEYLKHEEKLCPTLEVKIAYRNVVIEILRTRGYLL
jgi:hypothetical protein